MKDSNSTDQDILEHLLAEAFSLHEAGDLKEAELRYRELINRYPAIWQLYFNYGLLLFESGRIKEALECNLKGLAINPSSDDLFYNSAICYKELGNYQAAIESYRKSLDINPDDIDSLYNLAGCFRLIEEEQRAEETYREIIRLAPDHLSSLNNLAYLTHKRGALESAQQLYEKILEIDPGHESADFMRAALSGESRAQSPGSYVEEVFDQFAGHYDQSLTANLGYDLPSNLYDFYVHHLPDHQPARTLDLGCGTGLVGQMFATLCRSMTGVDISKKMLAAAAHKDLYDSLHHAAIIDFLDNNTGAAYDLVISADVLPYLGSLEELLIKLLSATAASGYFLFSVEDHHQDALHPILQHSGRFAHSKKYVKAVAGQAGWEIVATTTLDLRKEREEWIRGAVYLISPRPVS